MTSSDQFSTNVSFYISGFILNIISCLALLYIIWNINGMRQPSPNIYLSSQSNQNSRNVSDKDENERSSNPLIYSLIKHLCVGNLILQVAYFQYYIVGTFYWSHTWFANPTENQEQGESDLNSHALFGFCCYTIFLKVWGRNIASLWAWSMVIIIYLILIIPNKFRETSKSQRQTFFHRFRILCYVISLIFAIWEVIIVLKRTSFPLEAQQYACDYTLDDDSNPIATQLYISLVYLVLPCFLSIFSIILLTVVYCKIIRKIFNISRNSDHQRLLTINSFTKGFRFFSTSVKNQEQKDSTANGSVDDDSFSSSFLKLKEVQLLSYGNERSAIDALDENKKKRSKIIKSLMILSVFPLYNMVISILAFVTGTSNTASEPFRLFVYFLEDLTGLICLLIYIIRIKSDRQQQLDIIDCCGQTKFCCKKLFCINELFGDQKLSKHTDSTLDSSDLIDISVDNKEIIINEDFVVEDEDSISLNSNSSYMEERFSLG